MGMSTIFSKTLAAAASTNIALSQSPGSAALTLNGAAVTAGVATIDTANTTTNTAAGRRVIITSGGNDSGITWAVVGTNSSGSRIMDTVTGSNGGAAQSNLDFVTVTSITPSAAVATTATAGTNGVASTPWYSLNLIGQSPMNVGYAVELVSGACNFTIQHTYDDPNNLPSYLAYPLAFASPLVNAATATADGAYTTPIAAIRVLINSGTGVIRVRYLQAGVG